MESPRKVDRPKHVNTPLSIRRKLAVFQHSSAAFAGFSCPQAQNNFTNDVTNNSAARNIAKCYV
jgi:hypothetical protein